MNERGNLMIYTVCHNPSDFPGKFTCRRTEILRGEMKIDPDFLMVEDTIEPIRAACSRLGLFRMPRQEGDFPVIVETWF